MNLQYLYFNLILFSIQMCPGEICFKQEEMDFTPFYYLIPWNAFVIFVFFSDRNLASPVGYHGACALTTLHWTYGVNEVQKALRF